MNADPFGGLYQGSDAAFLELIFIGRFFQFIKWKLLQTKDDLVLKNLI